MNPRKKKYPRSTVEGLQGRWRRDGSSYFVTCQRCFTEMPAFSWPFHGSLDSNPCLTRAQREARAA